MNTAAVENMKGLLDRNVKDVISAHPAVGSVLQEFNVGCVTCSVGTCKLKDVVSIHSMPPEQERDVFRRIARIVFPGQEVAIPVTERKPAATGGNARLSPPMKELVEEHVVIKRVLALIPVLVTGTDRTLDQARKAIFLQVVDFIRNFADRFHHAKEEDVLFKYFDGTSDIVLAMLKEHEIGRAHVRAVVAGLEQGDAPAVAEHLLAYAELLNEHIRKEDEILYPWMNGQLKDTEVGRLFAGFSEVNARFGAQPANFKLWVEKMENNNR